MRPLRRLASFARRHVYLLALGAVVVGAVLALHTAAALAGGILIAVGMFTAGVVDPMRGPGSEGR